MEKKKLSYKVVKEINEFFDTHRNNCTYETMDKVVNKFGNDVMYLYWSDKRKKWRF
jgi:hypothetical protein